MDISKRWTMPIRDWKPALNRLVFSFKIIKKITFNILVSISSSIQSYMFMLAVTNAIVGIMSWMAFRMMGLENAGA